jgi:HEAT repeat protein
MPFFPELSRLHAKELMRCFLDRGCEKEVSLDEWEEWLAEVAIHLAQSGPAGVRFLLAHIPDVDEKRLRAILVGLPFARQKLSARLRAEICKQARNLLGDGRPLIVAEAVDALWLLDCPGAKADVLRLLHHSSPYVAGSVLRFLARLFPEQAVPILEQALEAADPIVRQNAIDELDDLHHVPALPKIKRLVKDTNADVRQAARTAVSNLTEAQR